MPSLGKEAIIDRVFDITDRVGRKRDIEAVEVELLGGGKARLLRIYIDKPGGVSHDDCEFISEQVGEVLDSEDVVPGEGYTLEVSSPGIERKLARPRDYQKFLGQAVRVQLAAPAEGQKRWDGVLKEFDGEMVTLDARGKAVRFPLQQVRKANLKFDWAAAAAPRRD